MKVRELMQTSVATVRGNETLLAAEDLMKTGWVRHVPVIDATERVLGVITQRDLLKASLSSMANAGPSEQQRWLEQVLVHDVMTKKPVTIEPEADLADAVDKLLVGKFGCLPVVEEGKLVGLLTETDLLRQLRTLLTKRTRPRSPARATTKRQASSI
jgi:CBS domain-containing membrane protein